MVVRGRRLCDLAPEALGQILSYLGANDTCLLWRCGEKHLQERMRRCDGVKSFCLFSFDLVRDVWPSVVREFCNLAVFRLHLGDKCRFSLETAHLTQLPPSLHEIVLDYVQNCYWAFREMMTQNPQQFPNLEVLEIRDSKYQDNDIERKHVDWPSSLRRMTLSIPHDLDFCELPRHLEYLLFEVYSVLNAHEGLPTSTKQLHALIRNPDFHLPIESLPRGLDTLNLSHDRYYSEEPIDYDDWNLENLPKGLTSLVAPIWHTQETLEALPRSLTHLDVPETELTPEPDVAESLMEYWPPSLTDAGELAPSYVTKDIAQRLPRGLERLLADVACDALPYLPNGVVEVSVDGPLYELKKEMEHLGLTTLTAPIRKLTYHHTNLHGFPLRILPPSLTNLALWVPDCGPTFWEALAESQLQKQFQLKKMKVTSHVSPKSWHLFPRTLTKLSFICRKSDVAHFTTQDAIALPNTLERLQIGCPKPHRACFDLDSLAALPKSLTTLDTAVSLAKMPSTLETRTLLPKLSDLRLRLHRGSTDVLAILFDSLPRSLERLLVDSKENIPLYIETVQRLPRELNLITVRFPDLHFDQSHPRRLNSFLQQRL